MPTQFDLNGLRVLITGAGRGLGASAAAYLARCGAQVGVNDLEPEGCEETVKRIRAAGGIAFACPGDVASRESVFGMAEAFAVNATGPALGPHRPPEQRCSPAARQPQQGHGPTHRSRWDAADALGLIGDAGAVSDLIDALRDSHVYVRRAAATALSPAQDAATTPMIRASLRVVRPTGRPSPPIRRVNHRMVPVTSSMKPTIVMEPNS